MKTIVKRFMTSEIVVYRLSNTIKIVYFDNLEDAKNHVKKEKELHPRSKKFNPLIWDYETKQNINGLY